MAEGLIIDDETLLTHRDAILRPRDDNGDLIGGNVQGFGLEPRNYDEYPIAGPAMGADPSGIKLIPRSEWDARIQEQEEKQSSLEHVMRRAGYKVLNQGQYPLCWSHSTAGGYQALRCYANLPNLDISAFSVGVLCNKGKISGGWCGQSGKWIRENGIATTATWPHQSTKMSNDTAAMRADMAKHKITEDWYDLELPIHGQKLTFDQFASLLLSNRPCPADFMWWLHSVLCVRLIRIEAGSYGVRGPNSWGPNNNGDGWFTLRESKAKPDNAICLLSPTGSVK